MSPNLARDRIAHSRDLSSSFKIVKSAQRYLTAREIAVPPRVADGQRSCLAATKWGAAAAGGIGSIEQIGGARTEPAVA